MFSVVRKTRAEGSVTSWPRLFINPEGVILLLPRQGAEAVVLVQPVGIPRQYTEQDTKTMAINGFQPFIGALELTQAVDHKD